MAPMTPRHTVLSEALPYWQTPDSMAPPAGTLAPGLAVVVAERAGDWARVTHENGWSAWVDARRLAPSWEAPAGGGWAAPPGAAVVDPGLADALLAALSSYAGHVADLAAGRVDEATFRARAFASGVVVRNGMIWLFDLARGAWARYDGVGVQLGEPIEGAGAPAAA